MKTSKLIHKTAALALGAVIILNSKLIAQSPVSRETGVVSAAPVGWGMIPSQVGGGADGQTRVYIQFKPGQKAAARGLVQTAGGQIHYEFDSLNTMASTLPANAVRGIRDNPNVVLVEEDPPRYLLGCEMSPEQVPYGIEMVQAQDAANSGFTGAGVKIGVIDSGVFTGHPDFAGVIFTGEPLGWDADGLGHGTHVCGTIAAQRNSLGVVGVSPSVSIHMVKVFGSDGAWIYSSTLLNAAQACQAQGCRVISMSLGGGYSAVEDLGFQQLYTDGVLLVASAGNGGNTSTIYPAGYASVISVAAIDEAKALASFSQRNADVELAGPGVNVLSTIPYCEESTLAAPSGLYAATHLNYSGFGLVSASLVDGGYALKTDSRWRGKIVFVERGITNFATKVQNVQKSGGKACVIYNNEPGSFAGTLYAQNATDIPAIGISQEDGLVVKARDLGKTVTVSTSHTEGTESYAYYSGTSMSAPHVSAVAALVWSKDLSQPNSIIRAALQVSAEDLGLIIGRDDAFGFGLVQAAEALALDLATLSPVPATPLELIISDVSSKIVDPKRGTFDIVWTTSIPATSQVEFAGQSDVFTNSSYVTSHSMGFRGPRSGTVQYYVTSTDVYGNTKRAGPFTHRN